MAEVALVDVNPNRFNELIRFDALDQKTWNTPSLSGNILLVRNGEEAMAFRFPKAIVNLPVEGDVFPFAKKLAVKNLLEQDSIFHRPFLCQTERGS